MSSADEAMLSAWRGVAGDDDEATETELIGRHAEPHRRYHTAEHVARVLRHVDTILSEQAGAPFEHVDEIVAAALFHDIVYDPRSTTNEADSALLADAALLRAGWTPARRDLVRSLILATAGHQAASPEAAVLLDADLAVLGAEPAAYLEYVAGVRFEYGYVAEAEWRIGRAAILRSFRDRPRIFATTPMFVAREHVARANLAAELATLGG